MRRTAEAFHGKAPTLVRAEPDGSLRQSRPVPVQCHTRFGPQPDGPGPQSQSLSRSYGSNLPTSLTYIVLSTRGCSPWRPAADMGTVRHENHTISLGFARADRGGPDTARAAVLLREQRPYLRTSRFQGHEPLQRKDNSSPGPPSTSPSSVASPHLGPKTRSPCPGWGILTPFPFGRQRDSRILRSRFGTDFSDPLGPTDPCSTAVHMEPFSTFSPQGSHLSICYYHQDLRLRGLQAGSRPAPSTLPAATLLLTAA